MSKNLTLPKIFVIIVLDLGGEFLFEIRLHFRISGGKSLVGVADSSWGPCSHRKVFGNFSRLLGSLHGETREKGAQNINWKPNDDS